MAHYVEVRVPFLDQAVVEWAMRLSDQSLVCDADGRPIEKWILQEAYRDILPPDIIWRAKLAYDSGSGILKVLGSLAINTGESELEAARNGFPMAGIVNCMGLYLWQIWRRYYESSGGDMMFEPFGNYPVMQLYLEQNEYMKGGTGENPEDMPFVMDSWQHGYEAAVY